MFRRTRRIEFARRLCILASVAAFATGAARAHDYWIDAETLRPLPGTTLSVWVAGGHGFPMAELTLSPRLLREVVLITTDRERNTIEVNAGEDKRHIGTVSVPEDSGVCLLEMIIQHPRQTNPRYVGRAILIAPDAHTVPADYATGQGIEIVPETSLDSYPEDGQLSISVRKDGEAQPATLTIYPAGERPAIARATLANPAQITIQPGQKYLVVSAVDRIPVSLVFSAGKPPAGEKHVKQP